MEDDQKKKEILLDLFLDLGVVEKMKALVDQVSQFSAKKHNMPEVADAVSSKLNDKALINIFVYAYLKHYTLDEIQQLHDFYNSELGKKMLETDPLVQRDMVAALVTELKQIEMEIRKEQDAEESDEVGDEEGPGRGGP